MHLTWTSHIAAVFDRAASTYDSLGVGFFSTAGEDLVAAARVRSGNRILDVGCGSGASLAPAAVAAGIAGSAIGIDIAPRMVERANSHLKSLKIANARAFLGDASNPNYPPESFDVILAGFVVFFLEDADRAIRCYHHILSPGGRLAISFKPEDTPGLANMGNLVRRVLDQYTNLDETMNQLPRLDRPTRSGRESNLEMLSNAGFINIKFIDAAYYARFLSIDHYWSWLWSHGMRERLEQIPPNMIDQAFSALQDELGPYLDGRGQLSCSLPVRFAVGERP